jgi:hypothetical protein
VFKFREAKLLFKGWSICNLTIAEEAHVTVRMAKKRFTLQRVSTLGGRQSEAFLDLYNLPKYV